MGCDGGTIPRRDELVRTKQKDEQKDAASENAFKWQHCAISQQTLKAPIVACDLGRFYNKEALIHYLLTRTEPPLEIAAHVRHLRDVTELNLTPNPSYKNVETKGPGEYLDMANAKYICPASGLEMNGKYKFVFNRFCGCVFSERALKNVKSEKCLGCGGLMDNRELVTLNPTVLEQRELEVRMNERKAEAKATRKKIKQEIKREVTETEASIREAPAKVAGCTRKAEAGLPPAKKVKVCEASSSSFSRNSSVSGSLAVGAVKLILSDEAKNSQSIAKDPTASEAFKSLFTSHETAKNKPKAHWITHNPLFY